MHPDNDTPNHSAEAENAEPDPALLQPSKPEPTQPEPEPEKKQTETTQQPAARALTEVLNLRWWLKVSNVVIAVATVANVIVAYWQFSAIKESNTQAARAADAAEKTLAQAQTALDTSAESGRLDQRAYLTTANGVFVNHYWDDFRPKFSMDVYNSGRTPALNVIIRGYVRIDSHTGPIGTGDSATMPLPTLPNLAGALLGPNLFLNNFNNTMQRRIRPEEIDSVLKGALKLFAFGRIDYIDVFDQRHWTYYCFESQQLPSTFKRDPANPRSMSGAACKGWNGLDTRPQATDDGNGKEEAK